MTPKLFSELGLSADLLKAIDKLGFEQAAPIQAAAIPVLMAGKDVVGQSQTGSGKTAAFGAPAIEKVDVTSRATQVLILCPTRELAIQVSEEIHKLAFFKRGLHALPIYGGQSYDRQLFGLKQGAHIVIGTPGRVMDHMRRGTLKLDALKMVILDEADVMLNMGFRDDIELILQSTPKERQTVFFSATMPKPIRDLIEKYSREPQNVKIEQKAMTVPTVEQCYYEVDRRYKIELLTRIIDIHDLKLGIIFCNTKRMVDELVDHLNAQGYSADRLHGDMSQMMRDRVMNKFRKSGLEFLVATDVAARGIDVDDVQVVFNYDLPYDAEDYVHRIGRTGRAGRSGRAISFVAGRELFQIQHIERYTKMKIQRAKIPTAAEASEVRANVFLDKLRATLAAGEFKKQDHLIERLLEEGFASTDIASALIHLLQGEAPAPKPAPREDRPRYDDRPPRREQFGDRPPRRDEYAPRYAERPDYRAPLPPRPAPVKRAATVSVPAAVIAAKTVAPAKPAVVAPPPSEGRVPRVPEIKTQPPTGTNLGTRGTRPSENIPAPEKSEEIRRSRGDETQIEKKSETPHVVSHKPKPEVQPAPEKIVPPAAKPPREKFEHSTAKPDKRDRTPPWFAAVEKKKASRATPAEQTRLWMNLGETAGIKPIDVVNAVAGETGLPGNVVGTVDVRERHLFVDVASESANVIIAKLNRASIKGHKVKVKVA